MSGTYKHKLGDMGPEHFDGDVPERELNDAQKAQQQKVVDEVLKGMPENAIDKPTTQKKTPRSKT